MRHARSVFLGLALTVLVCDAAGASPSLLVGRAAKEHAVAGARLRPARPAAAPGRFPVREATRIPKYHVVLLGTLGGTQSFAYAINLSGQVVGQSTLPGNSVSHPFLYSDGAMADLATLGSTPLRTQHGC